MATQAAIGVDVGTGSARAGVFALDGTLLGQGSQPIRSWRPRAGHVQQSSTDIWAAVCAAVRAAMVAAKTASPAGIAITGLGFDATCSLVVLDAAGAPVSIDADGADGQDVIVWMDHRATAQAARINALGHDVLRYVGGQISPEMQTPKLLWLAEHLPRAFAAAAYFFDLPDFLTFRTTGIPSRSLCSTVCKWTYLGHEQRWDAGYFRAIGLGALAEDGFARIGTTILPMGAPVGGLSAAAAAELGLPAGIPVGASAIDAHAGGLGVIGAPLPRIEGDPWQRRLALIGGTSSCHMAVSAQPRFVPGVWGPYFSAMVPGLWLTEAGQSATGALIDHVVQTHAAYPAAQARVQAAGGTIYQLLNDRLAALAAGLPFPAALTAGLHVMPDFLGNRSPRADPTLRGMVSGLPLAAGEDEMALLYLATIQAVAYGTRHIIETLNAQGYAIDTLMATGGGTRNPVFLREHADACQAQVVLPETTEAVLLGAAMLGAVAGGAMPGIPSAMAAMSRAGATVTPNPALRAYHDAKYAVFLRMHADQMAYRAQMEAAA